VLAGLAMNVPILPFEDQQTADLERFNGHIFRLKTALSYRTVSITLTGRILLYNLHYDHKHNTVAHDNQDKRWGIFRVTKKAEIALVMERYRACNRMRKEQHSPCRMTDRGWNEKNQSGP